MYDLKEKDYFSNIRRDLIEEIPFGPHIVLEVGCGQGETGAALKKEGRAFWVTGIELVDDAAQCANKILDQVIIGNIEHIELPFSQGQFDVVILGDVLEHLVDPWKQLKRLLQYVSPNGIVVASIPNVRNWRVVVPLLVAGEWEYKDSGILDKTHLRFFTKKSITKLFELNNLRIKKIIPIGRRSKIVARLRVGFLSELITPQYLIVGIYDSIKWVSNN